MKRKRQQDDVGQDFQRFFREVQDEGVLEVNEIQEYNKFPPPKVNPLLPSLPFCTLFVSPRKSGKTNLLTDLLTDVKKYCYVFDVIFIWSKTFLYDTKWRNIKMPVEAIQENFDPMYVKTIFDALDALYLKKHYQSLFIFDDMIDQKIMDPLVMGTLESVAARGRHCGVSIVIISQMYKKISTTVRNNCTNLVFFRVRNAIELKKLVDESREFLSADEFLAIYQHATLEPFTFLHVNNGEIDPKRRFRKNWDTILELTFAPAERSLTSQVVQ